MHRSRLLPKPAYLALLCACALTNPAARAQTADKFHADLAAKVQTLEKNTASSAVEGKDGWFFINAELRMLSMGTFWGPAAASVSRSTKPDAADPIPAILDFNKQLKDRGIYLLMVPVPPKAVLYPENLGADVSAPAGDPAPQLAAFYDELRKAGVDVLDLAPVFRTNKAGEHGAVFCKTDTHWSGAGCVLAAQAIADKVRSKLPPPPAPAHPYPADWKNVPIDGDLGSMLEASAKKPGAETIAIRQLKDTLAPDPASPLLLLGDSHALVFHDFAAERAGLLDQLAVELGIVSDRVAIRGSGATLARIELYRRSLKDPDYLTKKKVIVWCFTARDFTEAVHGWQKVPVAK